MRSHPLARMMQMDLFPMNGVKTHKPSGPERADGISGKSPAQQRPEPKPARAGECAGVDRRRLEMVRAIFIALSKYISARTIYAPGSPIVGRFSAAFEEALQSFFQEEKELLLGVEQYQIKWRGETVYDNREKKESLAFLLFKDGVGEITIQAAVRPEELENFVDLIRSEICCPSAHVDIVSRLWQSEFKNISYRVFDESVDTAPGEGRGSGGESGEQRLRAGDHPDLAGSERGGRGNLSPALDSAESFGKHLRKVVERRHPGAGAEEKELHLQQLLESHFTPRPEELAARRQEFADLGARDKLLWLLNTMLDFTANAPAGPAARDVLDITRRLIRAIADEAHIPSLIALLEIRNKLSTSGSPSGEFESFPQQIEHELTNPEYLLGLGKRAGRGRSVARETLEYFRLIGNNALRGLREMLSVSKDPAIHEQTCRILFDIAHDYIMPIVEDLDLDDPLQALDAVRLLRLRGGDELPAIAGKLLASPDAQVRAHTIEYLARIGSEEAVRMLLGLLDDRDAGVRLHTLAAVEQLQHPDIVKRVISMCFEENVADKSMDELERLFRALGKLAGTSVLDRIRRLAATRGLFSIKSGRARRSKLLAITALRNIPGRQSLDMLERLATDRDNLVRSKALHVLNLLDEQKRDRGSEETQAAGGGGEP